MIKKEKIKIIKNKKGNIIKFANKNKLPFKNFGEIYFSEVKPNTAKGWKFHKTRNQYLTVISGSVNFYLKKSENSKIQTIKLKYSDQIYSIYIPKSYYYYFKCKSKKKAIIVNIIDEIIE